MCTLNSSQKLRQQIAKLGVTPSWYTGSGEDKVKVYLKRTELEELHSKLSLAAEVKKANAWGDATPAQPQRYAAAFWTAPPVDGHFPTTSSLPAYFQAGLWSAVTKASLQVELWTFSKDLIGVPTHPSLTVVGAQALLAEDKALAWMAGGARIQHISDVARLRAINSRGGGWMLDGDVLWLRTPGPLPSRSGHVFNSMFANRSVPFIADLDRFWRIHYCRALAALAC